MMTLQNWAQEKTVVDGLVSVYKPYGISSTALTNIYKRVTDKKVGHGGTLDPLAEGQIVLGIGKGTKLLSSYLGHEKTYRTTIVLGLNTASGDLELPIALGNSVTLEKLDLEKVLIDFSEGFTQEIPVFSAKKVKGKAAYDLVRSENIMPELAPLQTRLLNWQIHECSLYSSLQLIDLLQATKQRLQDAYDDFYKLGDEVNYQSRRYSFMPEKWIGNMNVSIETLRQANKDTRFPVIDLEVTVPKGTYIRALATDIAKRFSTIGMVFRLIRVAT